MMDYITIIGFTAAVLTTSAFLPQVIKTWKLRETKDLSLLMYIVITTGVFMWLVYGLLIGDLPIIFANVITFMLAFTVLVFKIRYG